MDIEKKGTCSVLIVFLTECRFIVIVLNSYMQNKYVYIKNVYILYYTSL